ncbi:hypothetical protein P8452_14132 [Trifolium repens]|nr:hypothetical protein P8452_14132 [Trifolium repens]
MKFLERDPSEGPVPRLDYLLVISRLWESVVWNWLQVWVANQAAAMFVSGHSGYLEYMNVNDLPTNCYTRRM